MIKNIIFDIGGVLTEFDPNDFLSPFGFDEETSKTLSNAIFKNEFWKSYIVGKISSTQFKSACININPQLKEQIEYVLDKKNVSKMLPKLAKGVSFLKKMKADGYRIYILSNIVEDSKLYFKENFQEVTQILDGAVYSCEVHLKKPDEEIFKLLLRNYDLRPQECLFLDDSKKNIEKAKELGILSVLCQPMLNGEVFEKVETILKNTK